MSGDTFWPRPLRWPKWLATPPLRCGSGRDKPEFYCRAVVALATPPCAAGPDGTSLNSTAVLLWRSRRAHIVSSFHPLWSERPEGARLEEGEEEGECMLAPEYHGPQAEL